LNGENPCARERKEKIENRYQVKRDLVEKVRKKEEKRKEKRRE